MRITKTRLAFLATVVGLLVVLYWPEPKDPATEELLAQVMRRIAARSPPEEVTIDAPALPEGEVLAALRQFPQPGDSVAIAAIRAQVEWDRYEDLPEMAIVHLKEGKVVAQTFVSMCQYWMDAGIVITSRKKLAVRCEMRSENCIASGRALENCFVRLLPVD